MPDPIATGLASVAHQTTTVIARWEERRVLEAAVRSARDGMSATLVVRGEPGVGKTALLDLAAAGAGDVRVMRVAGIEGEMAMPFAGLHRLLLPFLSDRTHLSSAHRDALDAAFGYGAFLPADRFMVSLATLSILSEVAAERPLVCIVDDAQWVDDQSVEALAFVGRRLHADRIALLFGVRDPDPRRAALDGLPELELTGLAPVDARQLLASVVGPSIDSGVFERILAVAAGNPLAITEFARDMTPEQLAGLSLVPDDLPLSRRLEARFLRQIRGLPAETQIVLLIAAADALATFDEILRAASGLGVDGGGSIIDAADELVVVGSRVTFRHPLIRSAVYQAAPAVERRRTHEALASVIDPMVDPDRSAWHRAAAALGPDDEVADELERGAKRARSRGGSAAEASLLARAADLTTDGQRRTTRLLAAAEGALRAGKVQLVEQYLLRARSSDTEPMIEAQVLRLEGSRQLQLGQPEDAYDRLLQAAGMFRSLDHESERDTLLDALDVLLVARLSAVALPAGRMPVLEPREVGRPAERDRGLRDLLLHGFAERFAIGYRSGAPSLRAAATLIADGNADEVDASRCLLLGFFAALEVWDDTALAAWMAQILAVSRTTGALHELRLAMLSAASVEVMFGRFEVAESLHAEHDGLTSAIGGHVDSYRLHDVELAAWRGQEAETNEMCSYLVPGNDIEAPGPSLVYVALNARALMHIGAGRYEEALASVRRVYADDPPRFGTPMLPDMVEAGQRGGDPTFAAQALARLDERAGASGTDWALGLLARSRALVAPDDRAESLYVEALERLDTTQVMTDLARAHLLYGEWLRRCKRRTDARTQLRRAWELFSAMGADGFAGRAQMELMATGEKARKRTVDTRDDLTPQEAQIARLAARHETNREIATKLFISPSTVEYHLSNVYRKLGITSRRALPSSLLSDEPLERSRG